MTGIAAAAALVEARGVVVDLGGRRVLDGVDMALHGGEVLGLIGPNGAGKTTLLRALAGLLPVAFGAVLVEGRSPGALDSRARARIVAYLPQAGAVHWSLSVDAVVALGRLPHTGPFQAPAAADRAAVEAALAACDLLAHRDRNVDELSGGERARALLARALATEPRVLLADEPVAGLDPAHQLDVMAALRRLARGGAGVVVVLHDLTAAARSCDRLVLLDGGRVVAMGTASEVLTPESLARHYGVRGYFDVTPEGPIVLPLGKVPRGAADGAG